MSRLFLTFILFIISIAENTKIALFPSTGCYSHDVMMRQVGEQLDMSGNNVTWIQTYLYEFGFGEISLPEHWKRISISGLDERGAYLQQNTGSLIWRQNVPFDFDRPFNWQGIRDFVLMLQRHQEYCSVMLDDPRYRQLRKENVTVAVLDHFLQECMGGLAHLLNASVIQFSNWPISDGYVTSLNLPASPAAVPKTGTRLSSNGLTFFARCQNLLFHVAIALTRFVQMNTLDRLFRNKGHAWIQVEANEAQRPIFAGRSEMMFESVRPINNRIKFFGAASTLPPHNYISSTSHFEHVDDVSTNLIARNHTNLSCESSETRRETVPVHRPWLFNTSTTSLDTILSRRHILHEKYTTIDWSVIDCSPFVLVSFGSVAQVDKMHRELLASLLATFSRQPVSIVWQSNLSKDQISKIHNLTVPENVMISSWVPIKELLAHQNIQFIICHGGINTVNELALFGVPVLGVPLQGDQASNLARMVDLGAAELMTIIELNAGKLDNVFSGMLQNLNRYWSRSEKLARMLESHRKVHTNYQQFWLNWVARHGRKIANRRFHRFEYLGDMENVLCFGTITVLLMFLKVLTF